MNIDFNIYISYSTIAVFDSSLAQPFNDWNDQHIAQGFSWRPGSVSFLTLEESGTYTVSITASEQVQVRADALRAILVPFTCPEHGRIEIASISESKLLECPPRTGGLLYESGFSSNGLLWCKLTFIIGPSPEPRILVSDSEVVPLLSLLMSAEPAT